MDRKNFFKTLFGGAVAVPTIIKAAQTESVPTVIKISQEESQKPIIYSQPKIPANMQDYWRSMPASGSYSKYGPF